MKTRPKHFGTGSWDLMLGGFWSALVQSSMAVEDNRKAFEAETGLSLGVLTSPESLAECDSEGALLAAWCDWVTINIWGVCGGGDIFPENQVSPAIN